MSSPKIKHDLVIKFGSEYGPEEQAAVLEVLRQNAPTSGDACIRFEEAFAAYTRSKYARCVSNGTAALFMSMVGLGIKPGDRVITTPMTWIATAAAPATLGADVDFVDIDPSTYNLDPRQLEAAIRPETKAVIPVHLYGQCCDMDPILAIAQSHGLAVVEDACHAVGGEYKGRKAGSMGTTGCFSFHEQKNMSTLGEGGMIVTNDPELYERIALYRSHCTRVYGKSTKYCSLDETKFPQGKRFWWQDFDDTGYNFRMTDIQAAVGIEQLKKLDLLNQRRIDNAAYLTEALRDVPGVVLPVIAPGRTHVFHLYPVLLEPDTFGMTKEDFVHAMLYERGVKVGTHYIPLHWTTAFQKRGYRRGQFPNAERVGENLVTLPINPRQTPEALCYLVDSIKALFRG
ncbi:MAG TPA: DegT/DnrJ/EryC1/StrS family aminotransferase [Candidatus Hydrogenedentes bacterium]|nr:DegT/DnrJ/EryC1/StrS family aminotransferase [Candidatus Hydrogenedentota bacterium]HQE81532.1 DegT/DnrJ/EryC1/StrS family aminotransferase [Candidatus Hydrogenedentota bacterium]HQH53977.1 DegT/DnrJ/EryC1/StrS family aminotransferase [Candidatus Hydrogenedentota bacterium]HQM50005.1 DegT/DnrJ/EryC1/StrS family aminotransferase [Candidatus Hydrogenedentota bacterium]